MLGVKACVFVYLLAVSMERAHDMVVLAVGGEKAKRDAGVSGKMDVLLQYAVWICCNLSNNVPSTAWLCACHFRFSRTHILQSVEERY